MIRMLVVCYGIPNTTAKIHLAMKHSIVIYLNMITNTENQSISPYVIYDNVLTHHKDATLRISSSAVLYGMSVYTVVFIAITDATAICFRLKDHFRRLMQSALILGMHNAQKQYTYDHFYRMITALLQKNTPQCDQFIRITIHAVDDIPGVRTNDLKLVMSMFLYDAKAIMPTTGAKIKTSLWRRTRDDAIPARAKVNGAYVNSSLAKQDALDAGYDDALLLNHSGFISELTAANIFIVRNKTLITPDPSSDILEGITRRTILEYAKEHAIDTVERHVALTEAYTADELFACGTSTFITPIHAIDNRTIGNGTTGNITRTLRKELHTLQRNQHSPHTTTIHLYPKKDVS